MPNSPRLTQPQARAHEMGHFAETAKEREFYRSAALRPDTRAQTLRAAAHERARLAGTLGTL